MDGSLPPRFRHPNRSVPVAPPVTTRCPGADDRDRTGDLVLTKDALCQLSYIGTVAGLRGVAPPDRPTSLPEMERETGIEPATNSLEGCDSTTELLPPSARQSGLHVHRASGIARRHAHPAGAGGEGRIRTSEAARATDLQSAAFDRFATSPELRARSSACLLPFVRRRSPNWLPCRDLGALTDPPAGWNDRSSFRRVRVGRGPELGAGEGI
jgi:hypothetical protein